MSLKNFKGQIRFFALRSGLEMGRVDERIILNEEEALFFVCVSRKRGPDRLVLSDQNFQSVAQQMQVSPH